MQHQTRSILEELTNIARNQSSSYLLESTGNNIIQSAINFINMLHETYDEDVARDLEKRMLNSIRSSDPLKFKRGVNKHVGTGR